MAEFKAEMKLSKLLLRLGEAALTLFTGGGPSLVRRRELECTVPMLRCPLSRVQGSQ